MKKTNYLKIKRTLKKTYCKPDDESLDRLYKALEIRHGDSKEHRFITTFRFALAAAAVLVFLLGINSVNPRYITRYKGENIAAIGDMLSNSPEFAKSIFEWREKFKELP
ncbi:MAG: hypothetical protein HN368_09830 [Spirochaetales bacterium]|jgi:hypothetical protein|nr:hypothetical protein [Spirochaetales bacterium]